MNLTSFRRKLKKLERNFRNQQKEAEEIGQFAVKEVKKNIRNSKSFDGKRLEPLAESTLSDRDRKGISSRKPLRATGKLERSIVSEIEQGSKALIVKVGPKSKDEQKKLLFSSTDRGSRPAREVLGISTSTKNKVKRIVLNEIKRDIRRSLR